MKKSLLFMMALLVGPLAVYADFVSKDEAKAKAQSFISQRLMRSDAGSKSGSKAPAMKKPLVCITEDENPAYYIFNYADSTGFVIVSAESNTLDILAYSNEGYFHVEDIDKGAEVFLAQYERDAAIARANTITAKQKGYVRRAAKGDISTEVLLETACINQQDGYWDERYAPMPGVPAGCTATAATIIMHYHQWPAQGKGSNSYVSDTHKLSLSRDFSQDTYNWACIPKTPYRQGDWSEEAKNEVPKILLACGIASYMDYDRGGSGASTPEMVQAMVENFSYGIGYKHYNYYSNPNADMTEAWQEACNSIDNNMPVLIAGDGDRGSHAFVLDGYSDRFYHYNMGWGGNNSGWWANGSISYDNYSLYEFYTGLCPQTGKIIMQGTTSEGLSYRLDDGGVLRISGNAEITQPFGDMFKDYDVRECIIENGVTAIRKGALRNLYFSKLTISASVKEIERLALGRKIRDIEVAEDNPVFSSPGNCCLYNKETKTLIYYLSNEKEIHFPEGVEKLAEYLFANNFEIEEIDVPEGVTSIGDEAFWGASSLQKVTLPSTLTSIGYKCFAYSGINTITCKAMYPPFSYYLFDNTGVDTKGTLYVPYDALERYAADSEWSVFHEIKAIPGSENWENPYMVQVNLTTAGTLQTSIGQDPADIKELTVIGPINGTDLKFLRSLCRANNAKRALFSLDLSKARIVAGGEAYYTDEYVTYSITEDDIIPRNAFHGCVLNALKIPETTLKICRYAPPYDLHTIELPEGLKTIESEVFWGKDLYSLHIPASVEYIGKAIFAGNLNLTKLDVDKDNKYYKSEGNIIYTIDGKTIIAAAILNDETLTIPEGVESIYTYAFYESKFKKLCLPSTLQDISYYAFGYTPLTEVTCLATVPPQAARAFTDDIISQSCILYVPAASVEAYRQADTWSSFYQISDLTASAIDETTQSPLPASHQAVYDLSGRRISHPQPLRPGIYIINGKKVRK